MALSVTEESKLFKLVKDGCPSCGYNEHLTLQGIEEFSHDVWYNEELGTIAHEEYNRRIVKIVCECSYCEIEIPLQVETLIKEAG